ncbi:DedA family protein [Photobacterium halotolerans]|uniref:YqaA family protein n=1 Tax=Photobacterium halotolerans TaxID=265726 RepID=UPI001372ECC6|nr:YqaA family protein [Photobacterium halotolerans]NAX47560.1 DedA family protein [Photobacterium halotolerans]
MDWSWSGEALLWGLFFTGLLSATLLPGGSEAGLLAALSAQSQPVWLLVTVVTAGNTVGGMVSFYLGRCIPDKTSEENQSHTKAVAWIKKYGYWSLLLSWVPVVGDPLCLAAGWLRMRAGLCALFILIGKAVRYVILVLLF